MHATLHSQLGAIAKEYALPSTTGMILYLVSSAHNRSTQTSPMLGMNADEDDVEEPGPRLSEDVWKHLWTRVIRVEQEENMAIAPRSHTPHIYGLGIGTGAHSSPYLPQELPAQQPLRPLVSNSRMETPQPHAMTYPVTPSPSTPSSTSDLRSHSKSAPPSASSVSQSEPETPDTSSVANSFIHDTGPPGESLELPGLHSPSLIPILAKVEFEIDRRKAGWYEPWLRSRRMNHSKRAESRKRAQSRAGDEDESHEGEKSSSDERKAPLDLKLVDRMQAASPASIFAPSLVPENEKIELRDTDTGAAEYELLSESCDDTGSEGVDLEHEESEQEEDEEDSTTRVTSLNGTKDPLQDVFGTDADTWAELQADSRNRDSERKPNPQIVDLALSGADLASLPEETGFDEEEVGMEEEDEVREILDKMSRPHLSLSIPSSPPTAEVKRKSSPTTAMLKKHVPPPLVLQAEPVAGDLSVPSESSPMPGSAGSTSLPYLKDRSAPVSSELPAEDPVPVSPDDADEADFAKIRSPAEEKREGGVFDDLDLGLELTEDVSQMYSWMQRVIVYHLRQFDDDDPHDRRKSQYLMRAKLDEIERVCEFTFYLRGLSNDLVIRRHLRSFLHDGSRQTFLMGKYPVLINGQRLYCRILLVSRHHPPQVVVCEMQISSLPRQGCPRPPVCLEPILLPSEIRKSYVYK